MAGSIGAFNEAEIASPSTRRVSAGSMMPSSHSRAVAYQGLPCDSYCSRIGALKAQHQSIAKLHKDGEEQEHKRQTIDAYFRLRMAWERAVEEVLLHQVILRFRKGVETQRLAGVIVEDDDYARVTAGMTKCSNYAHDKALMGGVAEDFPSMRSIL